MGQRSVWSYQLQPGAHFCAPLFYSTSTCTNTLNNSSQSPNPCGLRHVTERQDRLREALDGDLAIAFLEFDAYGFAA